jgi:transcriptional regulator with GAF, ATPase, and Fis domain
VERTLGAGGLGTAYVAFDRIRRTDVVLKVVAGSSPSRRAVLEREFVRLRALRHPHLVEVLDFGAVTIADAPVVFYAARFIEGDALDLHAKGRPFADVAHALGGALDALWQLHREGLRHGDVRPENILVGPDGGSTLLDLSCCTPFDEAGDGVVSGTPAYLAPELLLGGAGDARADLFALGVTLRRLLQKTSDAPAHAVALVDQLTRPAPEERPVSIGEVLERLALPPRAGVRVHGASSSSPAFPSAVPMRLLGREREEARLRAAVAALLAGEPMARVLHLRGAPGTGRSRLLQELKALAQPRCIVVEADGRAPNAVRELLGCAALDERPIASMEDARIALDRILAAKRPIVLLVDDADALEGRDAEIWGALLRHVPSSGCVLTADVCAESESDGGITEETAERPEPADPSSHAREIRVPPLDDAAVNAWLGPAFAHLAADVLRLTDGRPRDISALLRLAGDSAPATVSDMLARTTIDSVRDGAFDALPQAARETLAVLAVHDGRLDDASCDRLGIARAELSSLNASGWITHTTRGVRIADFAEVGRILDRVGEDGRRAAHARAAEARRAELASATAHEEASAIVQAEVVRHLAEAGALALAEAHFENSTAPRRHPHAWARAARSLADKSRSARVMTDCAEILEMASRPRDALAVLGYALRRATNAERPHVRARAASAYLACGKPRAALHAARRALGGATDETMRARALELVSRAYARLGRHDDALTAALDGLARGGEANADLHDAAGIAAAYLGDTNAARRHLQAAATMHAAAGDVRAQARSTSYDALVRYRAGDTAAAADAYETALALAERAAAPDLVAHAAVNLAVAKHQLGALGEALAAYERAHTLAFASRKRTVEIGIEANLAKLYADIGLFARAESLAKTVKRDAEHEGASLLAAACTAVLGEARLALGDREGAIRHLDDARDAFARNGAKRELAEASLQRAEVAIEASDLADAERLLDELAPTVEALAATDVRARLHRARARVLAAKGAMNAARDAWASARADARRTGQRLLEAEVESLAAVLAPRDGASLARARGLWAAAAKGLPREMLDAFDRHPARFGLGRDGSRVDAELRRLPSSDGEEKLLRVLALNSRLRAVRDAAAILEASLDLALELTGADAGVLLLGESEGAGIETKRTASRNTPEGLAMDEALRAIAAVLANGEALRTRDVDGSVRSAAPRVDQTARAKPMLCTPVRLEDGVVGALYLARRAGRLFDAFDLVVTGALADQVAVAIERAQLVDALDRHAGTAERARLRAEGLARKQAEELQRLERSLRERRADGEARARGGIVGVGPAMRGVFERLDRLRTTRVDVLVQGASGTGKELVARAIWRESPREGRPFVAVNCAALPEALLESELFGHVRGAFTGAHRNHDGLFVRAHGGTVFLDEVGDMPLAMQVKLLRVLQEREVQPIGAARPVPVDVRIIAATHKDLREEVARGAFREDLFYRLAVVEIVLPPLRERIEDIPALAATMIGRIASRVGRRAPALAPAALRVLQSHPWPGNVRELENVLSKATLFCKGDVIEAKDIEIDGGRPPRVRAAPRTRAEHASAEAERMLAALRASGWNVRRAADSLGMPRASFYRKLARYGLAEKTRR